jgi:AraC-like DNA-binding protein
VAVTGEPHPALRGSVARYVGFREETPEPLERREGPGCHVVVIVSFGEQWSIDGERLTSFAGGLRDRQVTTRHDGRSHGIHVDLVPPAAHRIFRLPLRDLSYAQLPLEELVGDPSLAAGLAAASTWNARFRLLDAVFASRLDDAPPRSPELDWAWQSLIESGGNLRVTRIADRLGWSRKRLAARFDEEVGVPPKTVARIARFERARALAEAPHRPDWARVAAECGFYDQSHLINEFRAFTGRTPETFFQDNLAAAA